MKINPIAVFTTLAVAAAGTFGYVATRPAQVPAPAMALSAQAKVGEAKPAEIKPEEKVAVVAPPAVAAPIVAAPAPAPAPALVIAPSFDTVRVEKDGAAVIAGRAAPNADVVAKLNGEVIATAKAGTDGAFVMVPEKPLPVGAGTLSLESNGAGSVQVSSNTVAVAVKPQEKTEPTVAVLAPDQPTKIIQAPAAPTSAVVLDAVDYDAAGNIVFSGRAEANSTVRLYVDNTLAGEMKSDADGKWNYVGKATVAAGTHTLRADQLAVDGSVASRVELPFLREEPAKVAAAVPVAATPTAEPVVAAAPQPTRIVIQPGNNLWKLSRELYGQGRQYTVIYEANKDQIRNPRLIYPGQVITAPVKTP